MVGGGYFANCGAFALLRDFGMAVGLSGALPFVCWPSAESAVTGEVEHDTDDRARRESGTIVHPQGPRDFVSRFGATARKVPSPISRDNFSSAATRFSVDGW